ncbi:MAG TPA: hypothetical protein VFU19_14025 [Iamia sp.]|nr:hypothetical protein [Iamia sp.]
MRPTIRRLAAAAALTLALVATTASPASAASVWTGGTFNDQNPTGVCVKGRNHVESVTGGVRFRSLTNSYHGDCTTPRTLPEGYVVTAVGVLALNTTTWVEHYCGTVDMAHNAPNGSASDTGAASLTKTNAEIRAMCGIPAGQQAAIRAQSYHAAVIWGTWEQTGYLNSSGYATTI